MHAGIIVCQRMCHSSHSDNIRLPSICPTRKNEPGFTPLPRLAELPPATFPTPTVSDTCRKITCSQPSRPRQSCRRPQPRQTEYTGLRRPLSFNAAAYYEWWMRYQSEVLIFWGKHYLDIRRADLTVHSSALLPNTEVTNNKDTMEHPHSQIST